MGKSIRQAASFLSIIFISAAFAFTGCSKKDSSVNPADNQQQEGGMGKILYEVEFEEIHQFDFSTKTDLKLMDGAFPSRLPDGRIISVSQPGDIYIANADGSGKTRFFESTQLILTPQSSKDGNYIAFVNVNPLVPGATFGTYVYKTDGTKIAEFRGMFHPSWTPDGRLVMSGTFNTMNIPQPPYAETPRAEGLYITDKQLTTTIRIDPALEKPLMPSVSPDGNSVAFVLNNHIWKMNIDGTGLQQITKGDSYEKFPSWSPDGKNIAFNGFTSGSLIGIVPSGELTEVNSESKCWIYSKNNEGLKSNSQILWY